MSIVALFTSIGDHIPILKKEKFGQPDPEGIIASFHYRGTCLLIFGFTLMVTCTEWISGTDSGFIECLHTGPVEFINSYCYIMGTFSIRDKYVGPTNKVILFFLKVALSQKDLIQNLDCPKTQCKNCLKLS